MTVLPLSVHVLPFPLGDAALAGPALLSTLLLIAARFCTILFYSIFWCNTLVSVSRLVGARHGRGDPVSADPAVTCTPPPPWLPPDTNTGGVMTR